MKTLETPIQLEEYIKSLNLKYYGVYPIIFENLEFKNLYILFCKKSDNLPVSFIYSDIILRETNIEECIYDIVYYISNEYNINKYINRKDYFNIVFQILDDEEEDASISETDKTDLCVYEAFRPIHFKFEEQLSIFKRTLKTIIPYELYKELTDMGYNVSVVYDRNSNFDYLKINK